MQIYQFSVLKQIIKVLDLINLKGPRPLAPFLDEFLKRFTYLPQKRVQQPIANTKGSKHFQENIFDIFFLDAESARFNCFTIYHSKNL